MAKTGGLANAFWIDGVDLSGDIQSLGAFEGGPGLWDTTTIDKSAHERMGVQRSARMQVTSFFNPTAGAAHPTLDTLPRTDRIATYVFSVATSGVAGCVNGKQIGYDPSRGNDGSLTLGVEIQSNAYGGEFGILHTNGIRADSSATNGSSIDWGASSAFGLQAYLHVFAFSGTSVTVKLQESSDNGAGDAFADVVGGAFTAAAAIGAQRIQTARGLTVERYTRVVTTGTFSNAQFAVVVVRNLNVAVAF